MVQIPSRVSPTPAALAKAGFYLPPGRPSSRDERPSSRDSWSSRPSSRPSSRDSNVSGGRPASREHPGPPPGLIHKSEIRVPSREGVPQKQLHQILTQTHPAQQASVRQIMTAQGLTTVDPSLYSLNRVTVQNIKPPSRDPSPHRLPSRDPSPHRLPSRDPSPHRMPQPHPAFTETLLPGSTVHHHRKGPSPVPNRQLPPTIKVEQVDEPSHR